ncbi:MAG TPA: DUF1501 domain-containing protein [Verrucomicrobiota bacterium]|nr:DUF1501 domain-containing protein [Verrucomicrobiota bacterium]HNT15765.1 DUF1501 domain-containing protein [Verrucomicrobiota bacterium]
MSDAQSFLTGNGDQRQTLVVIFLRGGADGLNLVAPLEDDGYYRARPRIAISRRECVPLDGFYGLNPLLKKLEPAYKDGSLAIVHAAGSEDATRSHFEAQDLMEHAGITGGGWLGRFLRAHNTAASGPLAAVALGRAIPECLRGAPATTVLQSLDDFSLGTSGARLTQSLARLYGMQTDMLASAGRDTLAAIRRVEQLRHEKYQPANGADYGPDDFSRGLVQIARLIKARVGLQAVSLDLGGWDSHFGQGTLMDPLMTRLARGLSAFYQDLGDEMNHTTVVAMTEFGRRVEENSAFGTDHGRGSVMFVLGGGIKGGRVLGTWPGLSRDVLEGPGDLPVTTNYRNVLAPILQRHGVSEKLKQVFPDFELHPLPMYG